MRPRCNPAKGAMVQKLIRVYPQPPRQRGDEVELAADILRPGQPPAVLWFRMPVAQAARLNPRADAFAIACLFMAMRRAEALHVHGPLARGLLAGLMQFQNAWARWCPTRYRPVRLSADAEVAVSPTQGTGLLAFSGGLDSSHAAWRHRPGSPEPLRLPVPLGAGLMVYGFDIPLADTAAFAAAAQSSRQMLASLGLELLTVATNFRDFGDDWHDAHGAAVIACLHLFAGHHGAGLIASSHTYDTLRLP
ncbi:MAG: hypothetical protein ACK4UT_01415 [Moraxellaceae bacterium]